MSDSSRTLEQRIEAAITVIGDVDMTYDVLERAGLPSLLAERDAALERAETAEARMERVREGGWHAGMIQGEKERWALQVERDAAQAALDDGVKEFEAVVAERDAAIERAERLLEAKTNEQRLANRWAAERDAARAAAREIHDYARARLDEAIDPNGDDYEPGDEDTADMLISARNILRILAAHPGFLEEGS